MNVFYSFCLATLISLPLTSTANNDINQILERGMSVSPGIPVSLVANSNGTQLSRIDLGVFKNSANCSGGPYIVPFVGTVGGNPANFPVSTGASTVYVTSRGMVGSELCNGVTNGGTSSLRIETLETFAGGFGSCTGRVGCASVVCQGNQVASIQSSTLASTCN